MVANANCFATFGFILVIAEFCMANVLVPSILWNIRNPMFQKSVVNGKRKPCREPAHLYFQYDAQAYFICPHTFVDLVVESRRLRKDELYETIHLVTEDGFNNCKLDIPNGLLVKCNLGWDPYQINYELVYFAEVSWNDWSFLPNKTYYFISTSDGTLAGMNNTSGGRCKTHNMKLKVTICTKEQKCGECEDSCCEKLPTTPPPTTTQVTTQTTVPKTEKAVECPTQATQKQTEPAPSLPSTKPVEIPTSEKGIDPDTETSVPNTSTEKGSKVLTTRKHSKVSTQSQNTLPTDKVVEGGRKPFAGARQGEGFCISAGPWIAIGIVIGILIGLLAFFLVHKGIKYWHESREKPAAKEKSGPRSQSFEAFFTRLSSTRTNGSESSAASV